MNAKIKNAIVGLALGMFAGATQAATFNNCDEVKNVTEAMVVQRLDHKSMNDFLMAVAKTADNIDADNYSKNVLMGMAVMLAVREKNGRLTTAPGDFKKVCEDVGPEKTAEVFNKIWIDVRKK